MNIDELSDTEKPTCILSKIYEDLKNIKEIECDYCKKLLKYIHKWIN